MKLSNILFAFGLVTCLFSTSYAALEEWNPDVVANRADPNVAMNSQGAPDGDYVWCQPCGGWVRKDVKLTANTRAKSSGVQKAEDTSSQGQQ